MKPLTDAQLEELQAEVNKLSEEILARQNQILAIKSLLKIDSIRKHGKAPKTPRAKRGTAAAPSAPKMTQAERSESTARETDILAYLRQHGPRKGQIIAADLNIPIGSIGGIMTRLMDRNAVCKVPEGYKSI